MFVTELLEEDCSRAVDMAKERRRVEKEKWWKRLGMKARSDVLESLLEPRNEFGSTWLREAFEGRSADLGRKQGQSENS